MKYVDEFRDRRQGAIARARDRDSSPASIDICRTPSAADHGGLRRAHARDLQLRYRAMLPEAIELVHGPGCPVCVLPMGRVDDCVALAETPGVIFTTFGDAMRVPGSKKSLLQAKADGADVRMVYSPLDALALARKNPGRARSCSSASASRPRCRPPR